MHEKFATEQALQKDGRTYDIGAPMVKNLLLERPSWDFVIINDFTQGPARPASRAQSKTVLRERYMALLQQSVDFVLVRLLRCRHGGSVDAPKAVVMVLRQRGPVSTGAI